MVSAPPANVLIAYVTRHGQTEKIARRIAAALAAGGHVAELVDVDSPARDLDLERFDLAFVGAPVRIGKYPRPIVDFVRAHREFLARVPSALFSVGLAITSRTRDGRADTLAIVDQLSRATGWRPGRVELVAGALRYSKCNFFIRFMLRRIVAHAGGDTDTSRDYEYTDWDAVDRFAAAFVSEAAPPLHRQLSRP